MAGWIDKDALAAADSSDFMNEAGSIINRVTSAGQQAVETATSSLPDFGAIAKNLTSIWDDPADQQSQAPSAPASAPDASQNPLTAPWNPPATSMPTNPSQASPYSFSYGSGTAAPDASQIANAGGRASRFASQVAQVAQEEGVPADVLAGLIDTEDSGETSVSPAGARGIMQVVPGQGYDLPGEDASDPLTSIRQGARAIKDKYKQTGSWDTAGGAYFGYGTDAGGMTTGGYQDRYNQNRSKYQGQAPTNPAAQTVATQAQPVQQPRATSFEEPSQAALDDPDKWSECGPVAAVIAALNHGKDWTVAQAKKIAQDNNLWDPETGMHGLASTVQLLSQMGIDASTGDASAQHLAADASSGNTPIISTNKHYFILKGYDPSTGQFDTSSTGTVFKGGSRWLTLDEIAALGGGIQGAAYIDNPSSPTPSVRAAQGAPSAMPEGGQNSATSGQKNAGDNLPPSQQQTTQGQDKRSDLQSLVQRLTSVWDDNPPADDSGQMLRQPMTTQTSEAAPYQDDATQNGQTPPLPKPGTLVPIQNPDGSVSTELSITVTEPGLNGGQPTNIPTVWDGQRVSDQEAIDNAIRSGVQFQAYPSIKLAVKAAKQRTQDLGAGRATSVGGATVPATTVDPAQPNLNPSTVDATTGLNRSLTNDLTGQGNQYRQPLSQPTMGPDTTNGTDSTPIDYSQEPVEGPPAPSTAPSAPSTSSEQSSSPFVPLYDAAGRIKGYVEHGVQQVVQAAQSANDAATSAVNTATGAISQADQSLEEGLNAAHLPNAPAIVRNIAGQFIGPEAGIATVSREMQRSQEIQNQAADWITQHGRKASFLTAANDAAWRAANPDLAQEYRDLQHSLTLTVGGMVGAGGEHPSPEGAPRPAGEAGVARPEPAVQPSEATAAPEAQSSARQVPNEAPAPPSEAAPSLRNESAINTQSEAINQVPTPAENTAARPSAPSLPSLPSAVEQAHAALDNLEGQGVDVSQARAALPERPAATSTDAASAVDEPGAAPASAHEFSSTQLDLPDPLARQVLDAGKSIPDEALAGDGRETTPHVTVKYGLHTADPEEVRPIVEGHGPIKVTLGKTSVFPASETGGKFDVVKAEVHSPELEALNAKLAALPNGDTHPEYQPHVTLAYVKPGEGERFAGSTALEGKTATIDHLTFSGKDGRQVEIPLSGNPESGGAAPPKPPGRIPGMGYHDPEGTSPEAADLLRQQRADYEANDLRTVPQTEVVERAGKILGADPETVDRWQKEILDRGTEEGSVKGETLGQAAHGDAHAAVEATRRYDAAQAELADHIKNGGKSDGSDAPPELKQRLAEATTDLADLRQRLDQSAKAHTARGTAAARELNQRKSATSARAAFQLAEQGKQLAEDARQAAEAAGKAAEKGTLDEGTAGKLRDVKRRLGESVDEGRQARQAEVEGRLQDIEQNAENAREQVRQKRNGKGKDQGPKEYTPPKAPAEESLDERLGRLKREHGYAEDGGDTTRAGDLQGQIDDTLSEMRTRAAEEAQKIANRTQKPLTPEEAQRAVDRAIGRRASSRINREARAQATGQAQGEFLSKFDKDLGKKIDAALAKDTKLQAHAQVNELASKARDWHQRSLGDPANEAFHREEVGALQKLEDHSTLGKATADDLRSRFEANRSEAAFKFRADLEKSIADAEKQRTAAKNAGDLKALHTDAKTWLQRVVKEPDNAHMEQAFQTSLDKLAQHSQAGGEMAVNLVGKLDDAKSEHAFKFQADLEKSIADAERRRAAETRKGKLKDLRTEARTWLDRAIKEPDSPHMEEAFQAAAERLAKHSPQGANHALDLIGKLADAKDEAAFKFHAGVEKRIADQARRDAAATAREVDASRIRGVMQQIDDVLKSPDAPGAPDRLRQLHADLTEISVKGFEKSSDLRKRLFQKNLLQAGMAKGDDLDPLVKALARVDPSDPASIRPVLAAIERPTLWGIMRELQYVNMLSSPITNAVNITHSSAQIAARLLINNPLEFIGSRGTSSGTGAAFVGARKGLARGRELASTVMKTGINPEAVDRAVETGSMSGVGREMLTEKLGKVGVAMHAVSTRPLEAMDAMLGHVVYSSAVEQEAQRLADRMLAEGNGAFKGMDRVAARNEITSHIWDYPEIIQRAGKIKDYTLLKAHDVGEGPLGRMEMGLRQFVGKRYMSPNPTIGDYAISALFDLGLPFFNVPLNFGKQGLNRTVGVAYNGAKFAGDLRAERAATTPAERLAARTSAGENFAKAAISAGIMGSAIALVAGDNLTADGPQDAGQRAIWAEDHQPHSVRIPGTKTWISYDGTPLAVPFAAVANAREEIQNAQAASGKKNLSAGDTAFNVGLGAVKGVGKGIISQSFLQGIAGQYATLADPSANNVANQIAGTASRAIPLGSLVSWLARVTDGMERDSGRAQTGSDIMTNVGARLASRVPGLREQLDPRLGAYGEDVKNQQAGPVGVLPYYRGPAPKPNDPITKRLEDAQVGAPLAPPSINFRKMEIPLTVADRRLYQQTAGQEFRKILQQNGAQDASKYPPEALQSMRDDARKAAENAVLSQLGPTEIQRRVEGATTPAGPR